MKVWEDSWFVSPDPPGLKFLSFSYPLCSGLHCGVNLRGSLMCLSLVPLWENWSEPSSACFTGTRVVWYWLWAIMYEHKDLSNTPSLCMESSFCAEIILSLILPLLRLGPWKPSCVYYKVRTLKVLASDLLKVTVVMLLMVVYIQPRLETSVLWGSACFSLGSDCPCANSAGPSTWALCHTVWSEGTLHTKAHCTKPIFTLCSLEV